MVSKQLTNLLKKTLYVDSLEVRENEHIPTIVRVFGVRLHSKALSVREATAVPKWLGVDRSNSAIWTWAGRGENPQK